MAYTTVPTIVTGDVATASWGNTYIKNNFAATAVGLVTTAGDTTYATAANVLARLGIGSGGDLLRSTGSAPEWADPEDGSKLDGDHIDIDFTPSTYTPSASPSEAADVDDLAAHLAGIDNQFASATSTQATQAAIEAETNENTYIPPDLARHIPGVVKCYCTVSSAGTLQSNSYNITSAAWNATGDYTITIGTNFANANYAAHATPEDTSNSAANVSNVGVGTCDVTIELFTSSRVDRDFHFSACGDQ